MNYRDFITSGNVILTISLAIILTFLAIFNNWDPNSEMFLRNVLSLIAVVFLLLVFQYYNTKAFNGLAKVDGFVIGYFYNFLFEVANLIKNKELSIDIKENIGTNNRVKSSAMEKKRNNSKDYSSEYGTNDIKILIVVPNDLCIDYRFLLLFSEIFKEVILTPDQGITIMRTKIMRVFEIKSKNKLVLIDTPPTTLRALKLFLENRFSINHLQSADEYPKKMKQKFESIFNHCKKKLIPTFNESLKQTINYYSERTERHELKDLIKIVNIDVLTKGIIEMNNTTITSLKTIGDNDSAANRSLKDEVKKLIQSKKTEFEQRIEELV